jgi:hypothetical protein
MKKLKTYYIGLMCACMSGVLTTACTDDNSVNTANTDVMLSISVSRTNDQTRAVMPGADKQEPVVQRIWAIFCTNGVVVHSEAKVLSGMKAEFKDIPSTVKRIYVIGYPTTSSAASPDATVKLLLEADAKKEIMIAMQSQDQANPKLVNTYGVIDVNFSNIAEGQSVSEEIKLAPAMSRLEIMKIDPTTPPDGKTFKQPILSFKLDGIYINNTYTKLAIDSVTRPTEVTDILNYGSDVSTGSIWSQTDKYPANFRDNINAANSQDKFEPDQTGATTIRHNWGYYIVPLSSANGAKGTTINGEPRPEVVPHIVLKLSDVSIEAGKVIATPMYLTVRGYKQLDGTPVTQFDAGSVYYIKNLSFGLEDLSIEPEADPSDITVTLTVLDWVDELVAGEVD